MTPSHLVAQPAPANLACEQIRNPLTPEEQEQAKIAWQYFVKNYQPSTGFTNSVGGYPSGSLWDMGNYLMALNSARWLKLIDQSEFDAKLNAFLNGIGKLQLFEGSLPNKTYHAANGQMVNYNNEPTDRGIGWSALDIGRMLAAFHVIRTCHPQYNDWIKGVLARWQIDRSVQDGQLYGAMILPDGKTMLVQEGRLGYEEYAVRGYQLWGYQAPKALAFEPFKLVDIYGIKIPVDERDFQTTNANNYIVSESYILDGIEFGFDRDMADYASRVFQVQERRFQQTGQLTAVTEDNIDGPPYFLYNTVYANGQAWATITDTNKPYPQLRSISTKAAFGWRYLYPESAYGQQLLNAVKMLYGPEKDGFYAGLYEETKQPNKALTGNTNGLILEILYYKARGNRPLIPTGANNTTAMPPTTTAATTSPVSSSPPATLAPAVTPAPATNGTSSPPIAATSETVAIAKPIPPVGDPQPSQCSLPKTPLTVPKRRYAEAAWRYFEAQTEPSGLVNDRSDIKAATLWGLGNYIVALHAARSFELISPQQFDQRVRNLLGTVAQLPLFTGELPHRGYNTRTLKPVDYGNNPTSDGIGWSAIDIGRFLTSLSILKTCHPQYAAAVDAIPLDWSYLRIVRNGALYSAKTTQRSNGQAAPRITPETRLGYEEYAARGFQLWGFDASRSEIGDQYQTVAVEGEAIPLGRLRGKTAANADSVTLHNAFLFYGLELGFDPKMKALVDPMVTAQIKRYQRTGQLTTSGTALIERSPYIVHNTLVGKGNAWEALDDAGKPIPDRRLVNTAAAFAYDVLWPQTPALQELRTSVLDLYSPLLGYYEGFYEKTGKAAHAFSSSTNSLILAALLYQATGSTPLLQGPLNRQTPWWKDQPKEDTGRGLPSHDTLNIQFLRNGAQAYWTTQR
ncbi:DUF3131 domain-containing protein [Alkalinema sp. FACHB-956]|uniref:DUF3131 domain-containing protein n=1 Tax=Alkalinema sp. FACHB-956 TaxID=2692768 RepID=UPI001F554C3D|nr:DUF3131 domain-containing protein [Alkalinema sp. FACHB-956]